MSKEIIELRQKRAKAVADARAFLEAAKKEKRDMTQEEKNSYDKAFKAASDLKEKIDMEERQLELEKDIADDKNLQRDDKDTETPEEKRMGVLRAYLKGGTAEQYEKEMRALQMDNPVQAGYLVAPQQFGSQLIAEMDNALIVRSKATKFQLKGAQTLGFPKRTARAAGAAWGAEIGTASEDSTLAFGKREFKPNYLTVLVKVSRPLLMNSAMNVEQIVMNEMRFDLEETMEESYMTGNGAARPLGIFIASDNGISTDRDVTATAVDTLDAGVLFDAKYKLKAQYRGKAEWYMHRDGVKQVAKLTDGAGQYLWSASMQSGQPDKLIGLPTNESEYAPNTFTTGQYVAVLGDMRSYWIADSLDIELQRLNELYSGNNQVGFLMRAQTDGMPVVEEAFARIALA